jgi:hypothetical protein
MAGDHWSTLNLCASRRRLLLQRRLLQLPLLQLFFLRHVMPDHTTRRCTDDRVMARHVPGNRAYRGAFEASLCQRALRSNY